MTRVRPAIAAAAVACGALVLAAVPATGASQGQRIVVLTNPEWAPFTFRDAGRLQGYEISLVRAAAPRMGSTVAFRARTTFSQVIPGLVRGAGDMAASSILVTPARRAQVRFSTPYAVIDQGMVMPAGSTARRLDDLAGRSVATLTGSQGVALAQGIPGATVRLYPTLDAIIAAVGSGQAAGGLTDEPALARAIRTRPDLQIAFTVPTGTRVAAAFPRTAHGALLAARFDRALAQLRRDGTLAGLARTWAVTLPPR